MIGNESDFCWRVLIAVYSIQRGFRGFYQKTWRIVSTLTMVMSCIYAFICVQTYKNPWPKFEMGWIGEAAAAELTIDLHACEYRLLVQKS